ncbi:DNA repair protein RecN [Actinomyces sp. F1_1611]
MIEELRIKGLGVIDEAHLELSPGFTVITGETGAGKTMVLTSLRLLLGEKGDGALVRTGHPQIEIDAIIQPTATVAQHLAELGFESEELILSRTVPANGRSRAAAQGRPVPLRTLEELVSPLLTIHGQADQWRVRRSQVQRALLDTYAGEQHQQLLARYREQWAAVTTLKRTLDELHRDHDQQQIEINYLREVITTLTQLAPQVGEEEELPALIERYSHVADLAQTVGDAVQTLQGEDNLVGVLDLLGQSAAELRSAAALDSALTSYSDRLAQVEGEVADIAADLWQYVDQLSEDPDELASLQQRRADLEGLMKGRATTVAELLDWQVEAEARLAELTGSGADPEQVAQQLDAAQSQLRELGDQLHRSRHQAGLRLAKIVNRELHELAMPQAQFRVQVQAEEPQAHGSDDVQMELRARPDSPFRPLGDGASGGELSRVMLALEVALGEQAEPGTYIFDEVDQGIGGHTATEVGRRLAQLGQTQQVVAVTHLPQVAACADRHYVLRRHGQQTSVEEAVGEDRVEEIVRMLGGKADSDPVRRHAAELLADKPWQDRERKKEG